MADVQNEVRRILMAEEGCRRIVYPGLPGFPLPPHGSYLDSENIWTSGYGLNLEGGATTDNALAAVAPQKTAAKLISREEILTDEEALKLLDRKIAEAANEARRHIASFDKLSEARKVVVICMAYQMNLSGFPKFVKALNGQKYDAAAREMMDSAWARTQSSGRARRMHQAFVDNQIPTRPLPTACFGRPAGPSHMRLAPPSEPASPSPATPPPPPTPSPGTPRGQDGPRGRPGGGGELGGGPPDPGPRGGGPPDPGPRGGGHAGDGGDDGERGVDRGRGGGHGGNDGDGGPIGFP